MSPPSAGHRGTACRAPAQWARALPGPHLAARRSGSNLIRGRPVTEDWLKAPAEDIDVPAAIDTSVAHQARIYDYWLGGKDNFAADREAAEQAVAAYAPNLRGVRAQRAFLARAVRYLAAEAG